MCVFLICTFSESLSTEKTVTPLVGFHVALDFDQSSGDKITFNQVLSDYGNGWNRQTYTYHVPTSGVYFIILTIMNEMTTANVDLMKDSTKLQSAWAHGDGHHNSCTTSTVLLLKAGEQIYAKRWGGTFNGNTGYYTYLSGFLIQKQ